MSLISTSSSPLSDSGDAERALWFALDDARAGQYEDPAGSLALAERCEGDAKELGAAAAGARALATQGMVFLHRGDLGTAFRLTAAAEALINAERNDTATVEVASLAAQLNFFAGSYGEALRHAERAIAVADRSGDLRLKIYSRRSGCMVLGNLEVPEWPSRLAELMEMSRLGEDRWEEAISHNDFAHFRMVEGDPDGAFEHVARGRELLEALAPHNRFGLGVINCTHAELLLSCGRYEEALDRARAALASLAERHGGDPYLFGTAVLVEVRALLACDRADDAWHRGQEAVDTLGEGVPQLRSMILQDVAAALREAGRSDDAYTAMAASAELERIAFRQLTELQRDFERAVHEQAAARREADVLAEKNRELERRTRQLEELQEQLREQAERDWLTGLYNRRYLAAALDRLTDGVGDEPLSLAIVDLDHFKHVNDRFGHDVGDRVLVRTAELLTDAARASDVVARTGGEEFVVLMPVAGDAEAAACAERLKGLLAADDWERIAPGLAVTASIGVASTAAADTPESLLKLADRRLYAAKSAGRDRVDADSFAS